MKKYLIEFDSSQWCGGQSNVVVNAENEDEAWAKAEVHMEEAMRELFASEYEEEPNDEECAYTVNSIEEFNEDHEQWQFYKMPSQAEFYPEIE